jgi:hypothetical protein
MILSIVLFIPFVINILILIIYIVTKKLIYRRRFILTAFIAFVIQGIVILLSLLPAFFEIISYRILFWLLSGYFTIISVGIKILIFSQVYKRYQDPQNFHYNFFGKKVIHSGFMTKKEMVIFFLSVPIFLFAGAFFIARMINMILYDRL